MKKALGLLASPPAFALYLLGVCVVTYGPFLTQLGFYWDDFPLAWIAETMGPAGLARYFSTNRPVMGSIYQVTATLVGADPLRWQVIALLLRWLTGILLWVLVRQTWPRRESLAAWSAALFVAYPGFQQQYISFVYSHFFLILNIFLLSLILSMLAIRRPERRWLFNGLALITSAVNVFAMEYFFLLEILRPMLMWIVLGEQNFGGKERVARALRAWIPYLVIFTAAIVWRVFFVGYGLYQPSLAGRMVSSPLETIARLAGTAAGDAWKTTGGAWLRAFTTIPGPETRLFKVSYYWIVVAAGALLSIIFLAIYRPGEKDHRRRWLWQPLALGTLALFIAGGPFWLADLPVGLTFPNDRFTIPFMLGASLLAAALLCLIPGPTWAKAAALGVGLGFAAGLHFQNAAIYRQDWEAQQNLFWQLTWRAPEIEPGTLLLSNELPLVHYTDNSLSAPLNWIYDPENDPERMKYLLYYVTIRQEPWLVQLKKGETIERDYLATTFTGSSSQAVVFYYKPPGCLRLLDPEVDAANWMVPLYLRDVLPISSAHVVQTAAGAEEGGPALFPRLFGPEPKHGWCYYYEKADLARQSGDWETVARLGDEGLAGDDYPNDPAERFPFIEGYAHTGNWERAMSLSGETRAITPAMQAPLCKLWDRIARETDAGAGQVEAVKTMRANLECGSGK